MMHSAVSILESSSSYPSSLPPLPPGLSAGPSGPIAGSREVVPGRHQTSGSFFVEPARPVRLELSEGDAVVFGRGAVLIDVPGRVQELVDPLCAVWCRAGYTLHWASFADGRARLDWFTPDGLADAIDPRALGRPERGDAFPYGIHYASPQLFLAQRLLAELREVPLPLRGGAGALELVPMQFNASAWNRLFSPVRGATQELVREVRKHLAVSYRGITSVPEIARRVGVSAAHLSRVFKRDTGLSILAYRHELRMRAALDLLERGALDLTELALELGYATHSHFTARFKRTFGITPTRYQWLARLSRPVEG